VLESTGLQHSRVHVVFEVLVVEGYADAIESKGGEKLGIGVHEKV
jgi:hypothetical protein